MSTGNSVHLPFRGARDAPTFRGDPQAVSRYFSDIDHLYSAFRLTPSDQEKIRSAIYYLDYSTADLWERFSLSGSLTWTQFKQSIFRLYPEAVGANAL